MMKRGLAFLLLCLARPAEAAAPSFEPPIPVTMVEPEYPADRRLAGKSGLVTVQCWVNADGDVTEARAAGPSDAHFAAAAVAALKQWKFKPAQRDGELVAARVEVPVYFTLPAGSAGEPDRR